MDTILGVSSSFASLDNQEPFQALIITLLMFPALSIVRIRLLDLFAGKPLYGTLIALLQDGEPILGIIDQPILKERWLGINGQETTLNGEEPLDNTSLPCDGTRIFRFAPPLCMLPGACKSITC